MAFDRYPEVARRWWVASFIAVAASLSPTTTWAESQQELKNAARELAIAGHGHLQEGEFAEAADKFRRAQELYPAPTIALDLGKALVELGEYVAAAEAFISAKRTTLRPGDPPVFRKAMEEAEGRLAELEPRIPRLEIRVEGAAAGETVELTVNGAAVPLALVGVERNVDPGRHEIVATTADGASARATIELEEGASEKVTLKLTGGGGERSEAAAAEGTDAAVALEGGSSSGGGFHRTAGWIAIGVGGAALTMGLTTDLMAARKHSDLDELCPGGVCAEGTKGASELDAFRRLRMLSLVGYVAGGVGAAAGVTLLLTAPDAREDRGVTASAWLGPGSGGVRGTF